MECKVAEAKAEAVAHRARGISPVWILPLVAALVAGWLGYQSWQQRGAEVRIIFPDAAGIEANKTELRYREVAVGRVRSVNLTQDLQKVEVVAEVEPQLARRLSSHSRFWVVSPSVSTQGISGLSTLISGVYIGVDPGPEGGDPATRFQGSLEQVHVSSDTRGRRFRLRAESLGGLDAGSPVYYRQLPVGEVLGHKLSDRGNELLVDVFVQAPYHRQVTRNSRFWNISGASFKVGASGVEASLGPLRSLVAGGLAFDNPAEPDVSVMAEPGRIFQLHPNYQAVKEGLYTLEYYYRLLFRGSVRGLDVGAPVEFRGIPVGEVVAVRFSPDAPHRYAIEVRIALQPERLQAGELLDRNRFEEELEAWVARGLKAQLKTGNLLTGARFIEFVVDEEPGQVAFKEGRYPLLPTAEAPLDQLSRQLENLLARANEFPLERLGSELEKGLGDFNALLQELRQAQVASRLGSTLETATDSGLQLRRTLSRAETSLGHLDQTLGSLNQRLAPGAPLFYELEQMASRVAAASRALERLAQRLEQDPQALLFGRDDLEDD